MSTPADHLEPATLADFQRGQREAFLIVYDACSPALRAVVARFFPRPFEQEEAFQESWLLAYRMAHTYDPARGSLWPWLRTLTANRCKEILRARGRRPQADAEWDEHQPATVAEPETEIHAQRIRAAIAVFSAKLSEEDARVFQLSFVEERTHDDVAKRIGISARRCKYLRMKLLLRIAADTSLRELLTPAEDKS